VKRRLFLFLIVALVVAGPAEAFRYHIRTYGEAEGLLNQAVFGVDQTADGRIWLATRKGLVAYDGSQWTDVVWGFDKTGSGLRDVVVDEQGRIWIANLLTPARISWLDEDGWHHLPAPPVQSWGWKLVRLAVAMDEDGDPWVVVTTTDNRVAVWDGRNWTAHDFSETFDLVKDVLHVDDRFLFATNDGVWSLPMVPGAVPRPLRTRDRRPCLALAREAGGGVWVVEDRSVVHLDPSGRETRFEIPELSGRQLDSSACVATTGDGGLWIGTSSAVMFFEPGRGVEMLDRESGLADDGAVALFVDREDNVWVGTMRGLSKIVSRQVGTLDRSHGLLDDEVTAILRLANGKMVLGHEHGATILDPDPRQVSIEVLPHMRSRFMDMAEADDGSVWVALDRYGLARLTADDEIIRRLPPYGPPGSVFSVLAAEDGTLWVGGDGGLGRIVGDRFESVELPVTSGGRQPFIRRLIAESGGGVYAASGINGVHLWRDGVVRSWMEAPTPGALATYCVLERPDGSVWVGTSVGVFGLTGNRLEPLEAFESILDRPVYSMEPDAEGRVWFGTDEGIRIWDGIELMSIRSGDGLPGAEVNRDAVWLDRDGSMWVGTERGVTRFEKDYLGERNARPLVEFIGFEIDGAPLASDEVLRVRSPVSTLVARFRGVTMVAEDALRFRTRLEGFEEGWQPLTAAPLGRLRFTNLPPGTYRFHVEAVGLHGATSGAVVSPALTVVPPIWRTWWFVAGTAAVAAALLWILVESVYRRREAGRLEMLVRERTQRLDEAERQARASSMRMEATLQSISDGVLAVDGAEEIVLANRSAEVIAGGADGGLVGRSLAEVVPDLVNVEATAEAPVILRIGDGEAAVRTVEATVAPLEGNGGGRAGRVIALRDVTDRLRFEEEVARAQRLDSLGVLAGGIAHDFNNLLAVILGHTSILEKMSLPGAGKQSVTRIRMSSERASKLTQQLLTFARGGEPRCEPTPLGPLIDDTVSLVLSGTVVTRRVDLAEGLPHAMIDADQVGQALSNLLINACQAMPDGGEIRISGRAMESAPSWLEPGRYIELVVSDQGPGLQEDVRDRLFEPFFSTKADGNGLGLAVAYSVARRHGGALLADAAEDGGAAFTLIVPAATEEPVVQDVADGARALGRLSVLVMDDDPAVCDAIILMLETLGCRAVGVANGGEALEAWDAAKSSETPFDLAILDLTVPGGKGGKETLEELRNIEPGVRAVVASGYSNDDVLADPAAFGFAGAVVKPFDTALLSEVVGKAVSDTVEAFDGKARGGASAGFGGGRKRVDGGAA